MLEPSTRTARPTLATIAASAGVSVATVSKVVNGRDDVSAQTRATVQALLSQHDYAPPSARRTQPGSPTVEFLIDGEFSSYGLQVIEGVVTAGVQHGLSIVVGQLHPDGAPPGSTAPRVWARRLATAGRAGVIVVTGELTAAHVTALSRVDVPLVVIDPLNLPRTEVTSVGSTNFAGGLTSTQHLLALGHRRIAFVGGPPASSCNQARLHGYRAAMENAGQAVPEGHVLNEAFNYDAGFRAGSQLLSLPAPPTAVVSGSDSIALGLMEAARVRGLRIPDDVSVVGFDDTELAQMSTPRLTTIRQPLREMGAVAVRTLVRMAAGEVLESHHVELATELVVRGTTARLR